MTTAGAGASDAIRLWQSFRDYLKVEFQSDSQYARGRAPVTARVTNTAPANPVLPLIVFEGISASAWVVGPNSRILPVDVPTRVSTSGQTPELRVPGIEFPALYPGQSLSYQLRVPVEHVNTLHLRLRASVSSKAFLMTEKVATFSPEPST